MAYDEGLATRIQNVLASRLDWPEVDPTSRGGGLSAGGWGRWVGAGATSSHGARRAPFGLDLDRSQRGRHRLLPAARDQLTPALPRPPQVGPDLPVVGQPRAGPTGLLDEHECFHDVGNRPADQ